MNTTCEFRPKRWPSRYASRCVTLLILVIVAVPRGAVAQTISFTFDDGLDPRQSEDAAAINSQMLAALRAHSVTAMLFPAGGTVDSPDGLDDTASRARRKRVISLCTSPRWLGQRAAAELRRWASDPAFAADRMLDPEGG